VQQDANWNVTGVVDSTGTPQERYAYDPYGKPMVLDPNTWATLATSAFAWIYLHQGGRLDSTTGLYNFRNRDYSPTLGRWMEQDPIGYGAGDSNLYGFEAGDPTGQSDPFGLAPPKPPPPPPPPAEPQIMTPGDLGTYWGQSYNQAGNAAASTIWDMLSDAAIELAATLLPLKGSGAAKPLIKKGVKQGVKQGLKRGLPKLAPKVLKELRKLPKQTHHIATNKGEWAKKFGKLFGKVGMSLEDAANKIDLPGHVGSHIDEYHQLVYEELTDALKCKDAKQSFLNVLDALRQGLLDNPRLPYADGGLR
jgi:RHS repeat-associated protein